MPLTYRKICSPCKVPEILWGILESIAVQNIEEKTLYTYRYVYNLIFGLLEVHVFIVQIKILCWSTSYEHVLQSFKQKWSIFLSKKKKNLKEGNLIRSYKETKEKWKDSLIQW